MNSNIPYYRKPVIDVIARNTLNSFDRRILVGKPHAIPIERIIEALGLTIDHQYLRKNDRILGETVFENAEIPIYDMQDRHYTTIFVRAGTILVDAHILDQGNDGRLRYTLAHELSHWILHKRLFVGADDIAAMVNAPLLDACSLSSETGRDIERQADLLATALLMPLVKVKQAYYALCGYRLDKSAMIAQMAEIFDVSKQAMRIRLERHNLI